MQAALRISYSQSQSVITGLQMVTNHPKGLCLKDLHHRNTIGHTDHLPLKISTWKMTNILTLRMNMVQSFLTIRDHLKIIIILLQDQLKLPALYHLQQPRSMGNHHIDIHLHHMNHQNQDLHPQAMRTNPTGLHPLTILNSLVTNMTNHQHQLPPIMRSLLLQLTRNHPTATDPAGLPPL